MGFIKVQHLYYMVIFLIISLTGFGCATVSLERHVNLTCNSCHEGRPEKGKPALKHEANPSEACRRCHKYTEDMDHHPSDPDIELFGEKCADVNPIFPLVSGKMECLTCHQMHSESLYYTGTKNFLRGGPYSNRREVCFKCHKEEVFKNFNPHKEMVVENGLNYSTCLTCHLYPPNPSVDIFKSVKFRASVAFLCWRCHRPMSAKFLDSHLLKRPSDKTKEIMSDSSNELHIILPLDTKGRMMCATCHNPHQPGVMINEGAKKGAGEIKKLRSENICFICHSGETDQLNMAH